MTKTKNISKKRKSVETDFLFFCQVSDELIRLFLQKKHRCVTMSSMECDNDENENFIKTIYTLLQKL